MGLLEVLNRAQTEEVKGSREALEEMYRLIVEGDPNEKFKEFCQGVTLIITHKRSELPKAIIAFVNELMKRLKKSREGRNFLHNVIKYLVRGVDSKLKHIRINSLMLLRGGIEHLDNVSPKLWEIVKIKIGEKLFDKEASVRVHALCIVTRYQESFLDENLPFYKLIKDLMRYDPSPEIRKISVSSIVVNRSTISALVSRAKDENEGVRMAFVTNKLSSISWEYLSVRERGCLIRDLEEEKVKEIRDKFLQKMEIIFEREFSAKYEVFIEAVYLEKQDNSSLERVLRELMKRYEYADSFDKGFLDRATAPLLFLMRVSLEHVDRERGRDEIDLPDLEITLKSIVDASAEMKEKDVYKGSLSELLFSLLQYYDLFQSKERNLLIKCSMYILSIPDLLFEIVESVSHMIDMSCTGSEPLSLYKKALETGSSRTQQYLVEALLKRKREILLPQEFIQQLEEKNLLGAFSHDRNIRNSSIRAFVLISMHKGYVEEQTVISLDHLIEEKLYEGLLALIDLAVIFKENEMIKESIKKWIVEKDLEYTKEKIRGCCKALLFDLLPIEENEEILKDLVLLYYTGAKEGEDIQYLHLFFCEYFRKRHWMLFSLYTKVIAEIKHWKVLNDQMVFWFNHREDKSYKPEDFLLLILKGLSNSIKEEKEEKKKTKEEVERHLDLLARVTPMDFSDAEQKEKLLKLTTDLSKKIIKISPKNETLKDLIYKLITE
ncbi:hypothetical protein NEFER03_1646 [Nematocida sp. LUAm3]|nr:hypothetical protein NEFER03_1646 [Nematocida sp. LUAm3]KAI5174670.1 hypothetical protein NEFER02_0780 [Nematocida sp. LUAm2]KAI5177920.1 hypothetical protein NEFER01_1122 [Nematocida sp. LUAm1]